MLWALEHPWLTFWLVLAALLVLDSIAANICIAFIRIRYMKTCEKLGKYPEKVQEEEHEQDEN